MKIWTGLPLTERFSQYINSIFFKYVNDWCTNYLNHVFQKALENNIQTTKSFQNVTTPFRKTNVGQMTLPYTSQSIWSKTPEMLNQMKNLNMFKHNLKENHLKELGNSNSCWLFSVVVNVLSWRQKFAIFLPPPLYFSYFLWHIRTSLLT